VTSFLEALEGVPTSDTVILSMRGVPVLDAMAIQAIDEVIDRQTRGGGTVHLTGLQEAVRARLERAHILERLGPERVHWSADQAIVAAHGGTADQADYVSPETVGASSSDTSQRSAAAAAAAKSA
jgi:SulP family sulfate permease